MVVVRNVSICVGDILLFYSRFLRDASECCGESTGTGLQSHTASLPHVCPRGHVAPNLVTAVQHKV